MDLKSVKYSSGIKEPYVEFKITAGPKKGYITRRFGKILNCPTCKEKFFARNEQIKRGIGKFCSVSCAKVFNKQARRKEEVSSRESKDVKGRLVYFGDDGRVYTEKKDKSSKVFRYYGELRKCAACGEDFFADFAQIKLNRAKFCSRSCVNSGKTLPLRKDSPAYAIKEDKREKYRMSPIPERYEDDREKKKEESDRIESRDKPIGALVFGIVLIYVGIYYFIKTLRIPNALDMQLKGYVLAVVNIILGYCILRMKPFTIKLLYAYLIIVTLSVIGANYVAYFVDPAFRGAVMSKGFINGFIFSFVPYLFILTYLTKLKE
ncbi:MAG: hypothetical protein COS99_08885 [Candidatus Omnitrophica bacterium CG07_land_8_20_14_0_80_42_15]|uniref:TRASH domain-containing protein n=1 Tax=Candidatus Aquitaenariimonas noxiae TaxID=1974741 RepID=A0A2J0L2N7_9BACT|nr:MAG: hypothetical protein COS99_08885 [Candidatus Omnitrophica bacterium CG07_land_8_20_14_0_80_42_15]